MPAKKRGGKKKRAGDATLKSSRDNKANVAGAINNDNIGSNGTSLDKQPTRNSARHLDLVGTKPFRPLVSGGSGNSIPSSLSAAISGQNRQMISTGAISRNQKPGSMDDARSVGSDEPPPLLPRKNDDLSSDGDTSCSWEETENDVIPSLVGGTHEAILNGNDDENGEAPPPTTVGSKLFYESDSTSDSDSVVPAFQTREVVSRSSSGDEVDSETSSIDGETSAFTQFDSTTSGNYGKDGGSPRVSTKLWKSGSLNKRDEKQISYDEPTVPPGKSQKKRYAKKNAKKEKRRREEAIRKKQLEERNKALQEKRDRENYSAKEIQDFVGKNHYRRQAHQKYQTQRNATIKLQSWGRMVVIFRQWKATLQDRFFSAREYHAVWGKLEDFIQKNLPIYQEFNWEDVKMQRLDRMNVEKDNVDEGVLEFTNKKLDAAIATVLEAEQEDSKQLEDISHEPISPRNSDFGENENDDLPPGETALALPPSHRIDQIQLTKDVLNWLDRQDSKYRGFFIRRICQLANGERSRILMKHLTGSKTAIWETYLDQKSGQRILWTECETIHTNTLGDEPLIEKGILVWYVAKHDAVNRLMRQIDRAEDRSSDKLTSALTLFKECKENVLQLDDGNRILADPMGDTPLKLHLLRRSDIGKLSAKEWRPRLHLTAEERKVVDKDGNVLVLGRSGTGKTICIANRMGRDREQDPNVSQLFVARSRRICSYVRGLVEGSVAPNDNVQYLTFARFVERCERILRIQKRRGGGDWGDSRDPNQMTFSRFKLEVYKQSTFELDALIVWSQIRSFIKGSIEAWKAGRPLTRDEYMQLGKNRCRLSNQHRDLAYSAFEAYDYFLQSDTNLWDEADRVLEVLMAIERAPQSILSQLFCQRCYVDEVQDYLSVELAIFFRLTGAGGLFLAGDTAQSVSLGVDFRFEELRSIGHYIFQDQDRKYIPEKPVTVNVNFRSHSGILNVAAAVLDRMFETFPKSANTLAPDVGAFTGPRPTILQDLTSDTLRELVSLIDSVVLLTHDEHVQDLKKVVGENVLVLGIRYSKGLEFHHVVIVDFFSSLDESHHKPWRSLLSIRSDGGAGIQDLKYSSPEVETQMKLLYTAITRCSKRLFFAETKKSTAGDAFCKWLLKKNDRPLASKQTVDNVDVLRKTADEWIASGVDFGVLAETSEDDLQQAREFLLQAKHDFGKASNKEFGAMADIHLLAVDFQINMRSLITGPDFRLTLDQQMEAGALVFDLLSRSLVEEAAKLLNFVSPFVGTYSKGRLFDAVSSKFPARYE